jgi:excisionase family DNA binding protein
MKRRSKPAEPSLGAPLLTVDDAAAHAKVSTKTVRRWIEAEDLPALHLGKLLRIRPEDLARFLERRRG